MRIVLASSLALLAACAAETDRAECWMHPGTYEVTVTVKDRECGSVYVSNVEAGEYTRARDLLALERCGEEELHGGWAGPRDGCTANFRRECLESEELRSEEGFRLEGTIEYQEPNTFEAPITFVRWERDLVTSDPTRRTQDICSSLALVTAVRLP